MMARDAEGRKIPKKGKAKEPEKVRRPKATAEQKAKVVEIMTAQARRNGEYGHTQNTPLDLGGAPGTPGIGKERFASREGERLLFIATYDDGTKEEHWLACPPDGKRCTGTIKNGPYTGQRCRRLSLLGARVCPSHGGMLPKVKRAAEMRLLAGADLAVQALLHIAFVKDDVSDADRLRAVVALLDRAGLTGKETVTLEIKPWQAAIQALADNAGGKKALKSGKGKHKVIDADDDDVTEVGDFSGWKDPNPRER
jgi:hypothetical protein